MKFRWLVLVVLVAQCAAALVAQEPERYSNLNRFSGFAEYSNNSNHVRWGVSQDRKLAELGVTYSRRMPPALGGLTRYGSWYYEVELIPLALLRDPTTTVTATNYGTFVARTEKRCTPFSITVPGVLSVVEACTGLWTYMGGFKPVGIRYNFLPSHRVQPFVNQHLGLLVSTRDVPVDNASSVNFTFEFGAGVELFRDHGRSISAEYRLHHFSNDYMSTINPGFDSQFVKVTYSFGR